jgi:hypothetical protein
MNIFLSWSGQRSKAVAEMTSKWIKCVIQASKPWMSSQDIDRGAIWFAEISDQLKNTTAGIVFLTQENKDKPWILFETGALAKGLTTNRVYTFLIDLEASDLRGPLTQFNHTMPDKDGMFMLVKSLNNRLDDSNSLDENILSQVFETYWPQFQSEFRNALINNEPNEVVEPRPETDKIDEILNITRNLSRKICEIEADIEINKALATETNNFEPKDKSPASFVTTRIDAINRMKNARGQTLTRSLTKKPSN